MADSLSVDVIPGDELRALAARLRTEDRRFPRELNRVLLRSARPAMAAARAGARALQSTGVRKTRRRRNVRIRRRLADGVGVVRVASGVRITASARKGEEMLPRGFDTLTGWRHPVFGNRDSWVVQPGGSWFRAPIAAQQPRILADVRKVMDKSAKRIT